MIQVYTGDISKAGTDANVYITVFGERGDTGVRQLAQSKTHKNKFERGNVSSNPSVFFCFFFGGVVKNGPPLLSQKTRVWLG